MMNKELEKAIDYFKNRVSFEMPVYDEPHFKTILNALERNEPMKVIDGINYKGEDTKLCPNCESHAGTINSRFCKYCGQRLDWSVDND